MEYIDSKKIWFIGLAVIVSCMFGMWLFSPTEVVVTGTGKVSVPASSATFSVTINAVSDNVDVALSDLRAKAVSIKKILTDAGIPADNITETQVTLTPAAAIVASAKGFQSMMTISVKMTNVTLVNDMVVSMYVGGATLVSQPVVSVEDQSMLEKQALKEALKQARQNLNDTVGYLRPIRKVVGIQQASSGNVATATKTAEGNQGEFEVTKAVSVIYRVW